MENSPNVRPIHVMVMGSIIEQLMGMGPKTILKDESVQSIAEVISNGMGSENPMFIVTNSQTVDGAGVIFYPEVMDQIGEGFQGDFFILPSSTHETLVIPDNGAFDYRVLEDMVQTINENEVAPEERLSDHVYHYDVKDRVFERADKFEERQKEKAAQLDKNEHTGKEQKMEHPKPKKHTPVFTYSSMTMVLGKDDENAVYRRTDCKSKPDRSCFFPERTGRTVGKKWQRIPLEKA